jgi:DNA-binding response OmpR family regulator
MQIEFGDNCADFAAKTFTRYGKKVELAAKEAELLRFLINHRGQVLTRERILQQVWKEQVHITARTVDVHIAWLRQKMEEDPGAPKFIQTVRGEGYRFQK